MSWARRLGFLLVGAAIHAALYAAYTTPVLGSHKAVRSDRAFLSAPKDIDLLVVGDSHARTAVLGPLVGPRVANVAFGGHDQVKTWYRTKALVERGNKRVSAILVPLDAVAFSPWRVDVFSPEVVWGRYVDFFELGRVEGHPFKYAGAWVKARLVPYAGELRTLNQLRRGRMGFGEDLPNGDFSAMTPDQRRDTARRDASDHLDFDDHAQPVLRWGFESLVAWADARDITVIGIGYPLSAEYRALLAETDAEAQVRQKVLEPFLRDPDHVWLDHGEVFDGHPELFSDPHHLNTRGRALFSRFLGQELRKRGLLPERAGSPSFPVAPEQE